MKTQRRYEIGDRFTMSESALENYGEKWRGKKFTVRQWFDHYAKPADMDNDRHGHPGFDSGAGSALYEADGLNLALYEWEMIPS